jgi:transcriptional regulator with XRE-family HTH domain
MVHIGKKIKQQLALHKLSVSEFATKINTNRNNVYNIFTRQSIDTDLLYKIGIILNHDFFQYYNQNKEVNSSEEENDFTMPERDWFVKQFKTLNRKIDSLIKKGY